MYRTTRRHTLQALAAAICAGGIPRGALAAAPASTTSFFNADETAFVTVLADTLIPTTDTPGAKQAGVVATFDGLMTAWASAKRRRAIKQAIATLGRDLNSRSGGSFVKAARAQQHDALAALDADAYGSQSVEYRDYRAIKTLLVRLYYASQPGATMELRYDPVPGLYDGDVAFAEGGRTWAPLELGGIHD